MAYLKQTTKERVPRNVNISRTNSIMPHVCYTLYRSFNKIMKAVLHEKFQSHSG